MSRILGIGILALGVFGVQQYFPVLDRGSWDGAVLFRFDDEVCRERRAERELVEYVHGDDEPALTVEELAIDYNLELARVCAANGWPRQCGRQRIAPGDGLRLPLSLSGPITAPASGEPGGPGEPVGGASGVAGRGAR